VWRSSSELHDSAGQALGLVFGDGDIYVWYIIVCRLLVQWDEFRYTVFWRGVYALSFFRIGTNPML
jgi:hypothetical protein